MARQAQPDPNVHTDAAGPIKAVADRLALRHGSLPYQRFQEAIGKLLTVFGQEIVHDPPSLDCYLCRFPLSLLEDALAFLPADMACAIVLEEEVEVLAQRALAANYLVLEHTPLLSLSELADQLDLFIAYLEGDREHLVKTGLPRKRFSSCPWLYRHLARLYDVRCTGSPYPKDELFDDWPENEAAYTWGRYVPDSADPNDRFSGISGAVRWEPCLYEAADLLSGIEAEDAAHIEADRTKIFDLKIELLRLSASAARQNDVTGYWGACVRVLTDRLLADEADFYLRMDRHYLGNDARQVATYIADRKMIPGGLTDLLELVRHVEQEITIGTMAKTHEALAGLLAPGWNVDPRYGRPNSSEAYFQLVARHGRNPLDGALDLFRSLAVKEKVFWDEYCRRVNDTLENNFCDEVIIRKKVKRKLVEKFEPNVRTYADWVHTQIQAGGSPPQLVLSVPASEGNIFRFSGDTWTMRYDGKLLALPKTPGLFYISFLLEQPGKSFHPAELRRAYHQFQDPAQRAADDYQALEAALDEGVADLGEVVDKVGIAASYRFLHVIDQDIKEAKRHGKEAEVNLLNVRKQRVEAYLHENYRPGGKLRKLFEQSKRDRDAVRNAIERALEKIRTNSVALHRHLHNSLKYGEIFCYEPESPIRWNP
jgi:hypothetical protein